MFLAEFMLGTLAFVFREHLARSLKEELLYGIEKHYNVTREPGTLSAMWDHIHTEVCLIKIFEKDTHKLLQIYASYQFISKKLLSKYFFA